MKTRSTINYRPDIDCLRAIAVLMVILFHCDISWMRGGFIGVDIFFVISGYVMYQSTTRHGTFRIHDFLPFYKKRLFRIYPVLLLTLSITAFFAVLWMSVQSLDYFGKQLFFSSLSLSNILFAQGKDYFSANTPILLHTWSLGVEMQFYLLFPFLIYVYHILQKRKALAGLCFLLITTVAAFFYAQLTVDSKGTFYLLQNRAFEFLIGVTLCALPIKRSPKKAPTSLLFLLLVLLGLSAVFFKPEPYHPGLQTLIPVGLSASLILLYAQYQFFTYKGVQHVAYIGCISYGIYLFHFPVTVFAKDIFHLSPLGLLTANLFITLPLAHISYKYFETPVRRYGYSKHLPIFSGGLILACALVFATAGYVTAKADGWPQRLKMFNPYAHSVSDIHTQAKSYYVRGYNVQSAKKTGTALFIGDSVLQNYIDSIAHALNIPKKEIDTITRGGCVLLKEVDFRDSFADISCHDLRNRLYTLDKKYDVIIFSQSWGSYINQIQNKPLLSEEDASYSYIAPFISPTIIALKEKSNRIIMLGQHPEIGYNHKLDVGPQLTPLDYESFKNSLHVSNIDAIENYLILTDIADNHDIEIIHPIDIFCPHSQENCTLHNAQWSYFYDSQHLTKTGQEFARRYFIDYFKINDPEAN